ncbi:MAG: hypothetical protein HY286_02085 [Planctomycetes bacterium]|nr:hypothetical protein [Planctomycetota bacterium]
MNDQTDRKSFDGTVFVNARFLQVPLDLLLLENKATEISFTDLVAFLNFIDNYSISGRLTYDPTIPTETLRGIDESVDRVKGLLGDEKFSVERMPIPRGDVNWLAPEALRNAAKSIASVDPVNIDANRETKLDAKKTDEFQLQISRAVRESADVERLQIAEEVRQRNITGSKLLFALFQPEFDDLLRIVASRSGQCKDRDALGAYFAALINRFRLHLLSKWSEECNGSHLVGSHFDYKSLAGFSRAVWEDFLDAPSRLQKTQSDLSSARMAESTVKLRQLLNESPDLSLPEIIPPIGLVALARSDPAEGPIGVLRKANELVSKNSSGRAFRSLIWRNAHRDPEMQKKLAEEWYQYASQEYQKDLGKSIVAQDPMKSILSLSGDVISEESVSIALSQFIDSTIAGFIASPSLMGIIPRIVQAWQTYRATSGKRGYINFYQIIARDIQQLGDFHVEDRVKQIFGRPLKTN